MCGQGRPAVWSESVVPDRLTERGQDETEDSVLSGSLLLDEKERAEHIMLVDLERNDLGKVCQWGSVKVDELLIFCKTCFLKIVR